MDVMSKVLNQRLTLNAHGSDLLLLCLVFSLCIPAIAEEELAQYRYRQTKNLILYVRSAKELFQQKEKKAFKEFRKEDGKWFSKNKYLFVYDLHGTNIFHPVNPEFEGKNLIGLKDMDGKPVIQFLIDAVTESDTSSGWVHYSWLEPGEIFPLWKSSYVVKATTRSGEEYLIGSGLYNMRLEKQFAVETVDSAVKLIEKDGVKAFDAFRDKSSRYIYYGTYIFVISEDGTAIVDPAFPTRKGRNLFDLRDAEGKYSVREMIEKLKTQNSAWVMYMWPKPGDVTPSRKVAYIRKVRIGDKNYIVGSALFLADPIWLKL